MAEVAVQAAAVTENIRQVEALSEWANGSQQAEHLRGIVAANLASMPVDVGAEDRENAQRRETWALGLASRLDVVPA